MVTLRSRTVLMDKNKNTAITKTVTSKKRKAEQAPLTIESPTIEPPAIEPPAIEEKENINSPPSTPPAARSLVSIEPEQKQIEKTPGRVRPYQCLPTPPDPDIKPFKGPRGKKIRKTWWEKEEEYKQYTLDNEGHVFHELHVCFEKGPNGSPTYDKAGFQLDYDKVAHWVEPTAYNKSKIVKGMERAVDKIIRDRQRMAEIFFEKGEAPEDSHFGLSKEDYWKDRVSKDLNVPWHKIEVAHFEEWEKRGFKRARKGEYETFTQEEKDRMSRMMSGASLRK